MEPVQQEILFGPGFLDALAGKITQDPVVALVELVANAWDAGATVVRVEVPEGDQRELFVVDNGHGMTSREFLERWHTLSYDRRQNQGDLATFPKSNAHLPPRRVFGRNGIGRFAPFAFGSSYLVRTTTDKTTCAFRVNAGHLGDRFPRFRL